MKLSNEGYLRLEMIARLSRDDILHEVNERHHIRRCRPAAIYHDVGVPSRDLGSADAGAFQPALVDQASGADAFDFLEDGPGARLRVQRRVPLSPPLQVCGHDLLHPLVVARRELEGDRQYDVIPLM